MFHLASPLYLLFVPVVIGFTIYRWFRAGLPELSVSTLSGMQGAASHFTGYILKMLLLVRMMALICLIVALARPQWGEQRMDVTTEGVNIILALDLSESMLAMDFKKEGQVVNRLEAVRSVVRKFIEKRESDRIGMVVFGSQAFTQMPLTRDYNSLAFVLDQLEIGAAGPSTAIGDAIGISLKRLKDIKSKSNIIILLTDGKSNSGHLSWQDAVSIAAEQKVKIYTIGVGSRGKAPFLVNGIFGKQYVYRFVDVDLGALQSIAKETGGQFFKAEDTQGLKEIYDAIDKMEKTKVDVKKWVEYQDFYQGFIIAGLLLFLLSVILTRTRFLEVP